MRPILLLLGFILSLAATSCAEEQCCCSVAEGEYVMKTKTECNNCVSETACPK